MIDKTFRVAVEDGEWSVYTAEKPEGSEEYVFMAPRASGLSYPDTSMPPECEGHQCDWRGGPIHVPGCPLYAPP